MYHSARWQVKPTGTQKDRKMNRTCVKWSMSIVIAREEDGGVEEKESVFLNRQLPRPNPQIYLKRGADQSLDNTSEVA